MELRELIQDAETSAMVPTGRGDRFAGYTVIGLPFLSGHVLAMRRFPASSLGPGYTTIWHRDPHGKWIFYSTVAPKQSCARYFGSQINENVHAQITIEWSRPETFRIVAECSRPVAWEITMKETVASRLMNLASRLVPDAWWRKRFILRVMGLAAQVFLGTGRMNLTGRSPNGQEFTANPQQVWLVEASRAVINGVDLGPPGPLPAQARLNDFLIPQRGLFAVGRSFMEKRNNAVE